MDFPLLDKMGVLSSKQAGRGHNCLLFFTTYRIARQSAAFVRRLALGGVCPPSVQGVVLKCNRRSLQYFQGSSKCNRFFTVKACMSHDMHVCP